MRAAGNLARHKGYELHGIAAVELCRMRDASLGSVRDDGAVTTLKLMHNQRLIANWTGPNPEIIASGSEITWFVN